MLVVVALFLISAAVRAWMFYWFHGFPALYAKDLGVNFIVAEYMRHTIHSPRDFLDMLGWAVWWDQPFFSFNSYASYALIVPISNLVHSTWASIKLLEIAQSGLACAGTFYLLRQFGRPRAWSLAAAVTYASIPAVAFMPRGNLDLGWPAVLVPGCLGLGIALIRRFGSSALPLCGIFCAVCGLCPAIEYVVFVSFPIYLILYSYAVLENGATRSAIYGLIGAAFVVSFGAYFLVPTFAIHLFSDSTARTVSLVQATFAAYFSEAFISYLALIPQEALLSPVALYNATPLIPLALAGGVTIWIFAIIGLLRRSGSLFANAFSTTATLTVICLIFLSSSALLPGGDVLWHFFGSLPVIDAIRTPDRFMTLPMLAVVIMAFEGLRACVTEMPSQRFIGAVVVAVVLMTSSYIDVAQQVWANQQDYGFEEPGLEQANVAAAKLGARTVPFAFLNGGSTADYPAYGVPTPTFSGYWDLASRYIQDGVALTGLLSRAAVKTVITTPTWAASGAEGYPDFGTIFLSTRGVRQIFKSPENVRVFALKGGSNVAFTHVLCLEGGPGILDNALALPEFKRTDFGEPTAICGSRLFVDRDAWDEADSARYWVSSGRTLCPSCQPVMDIDYTFDPGRELLNQPWYRSSIDGDAPVFADRAVALPSNTTLRIPIVNGAKNRTFAVRLASHAYARLELRCTHFASSVRLLPFKGFRWIAQPLPDRCGTATLSLHIDGTQPANINNFARGVALDGVAVFLRPAARSRGDAANSHDVFLFSTNHFDRVVDPTFLMQTVRPDRPTGTAILKWRGPSRSALIFADIAPGTGSVSISSERRPVCCSKAPSRPQPERFLAARTFLHRGDDVVATVTGENTHSAAVDALAAIELTGQVSLFDVSQSLVAGDIDFSNGPAALGQLSAESTFQTDAISSVGISGTKGTALKTGVAPIPGAAHLTVGFLGVEGSGAVKVTVSCGARVATTLLAEGYNSGIFIRLNGSPCRVSLVWMGDLTIARIFFNVDRSHVTADASFWIPKGTYRVALYSRTLAALDLGSVRADGRIVAPNSNLKIRTTGAHKISLEGMPAEGAFILLVPAALQPAVATPLVATQTGAARYDVEVRHTTDVRIAHLDDGNWELRGANGAVFGERCDLIATCYINVAKGRYQLARRLPAAVSLGLLITFGSLVLAIGLLAFSPRAVGK